VIQDVSQGLGPAQDRRISRMIIIGLGDQQAAFGAQGWYRIQQPLA
jgi:hypothetical protein